MLPTPGLSAGSCVAPPPKAYSIAISGTVASCTNQASMPPGEIRCWILAAACDGVDAKRHHRQAGGDNEGDARGAARSPGMDHERFSSRFGVVSLIR